MLIKLSRQCLGQEIVDAFQTACSFQESPEKKWGGSQFIGEFQYEAGSARQTIRSIGIRVASSLFKKKWILFGKKAWKEDHGLIFTLRPVALKQNYAEINIAVRYVYLVDQGGGEYIATDPHSPAFEDIQPQFEKILTRFFANLM